MFTGIIETVGEVVAKELREGDVKLTLKADESYLEAVMLGDSIACNGVCLTVVDRTSNQFMLDVSVETLSLTTIGDWDVGSKVNLEQAMIASSRFGGHIVSGHIDRIGEIIDIVKKKLEFSTFSTDINLRFYYSYLSSNFRGLDYSS